MKFVIEHLDPRLFTWSLLEYKHVSEIVGKKNLLFTNLKNNIQAKKLKPFGKVSLQPVKEVIKEKAIVLDPSSNKRLTNRDCKTYKTLIFGGILGDYPPKKRTVKHFKELPIGWVKRNLGKKQMSTDTAVIIAKMIADGATWKTIHFKDHLTIKTGKNEEVKLPYRYLVINNNPLLAPGIIALIKKKGF